MNVWPPHNPSSTLMEDDVTIKAMEVDGKTRGMVEVELKYPKESRKSSVNVGLFANTTKVCPVKAFKDWKRISKLKGKSGHTLGA